MAGLFFCLASAEGAGLLFCPAAIQTRTSVYSAFCAVNAIIPPAPQNITRGFAVDFPAVRRVLPPLCGGCIRLYRTTCATLERITATQHRSAQPPYYNKVYKVQGCALLWIHARRCSISQTIPAAAHLLRGQPGWVSILSTSGGLQSGTGSTVNQGGAASWHLPPSGAVQRQGRGGRRGTIDGCRRFSFRAFAR